MITIVRAVQTSIACPAQWDLWDADGNYYYARFRHGYGSVRQYQSENWIDAPWDESVPEGTVGYAYVANTEYIGLVASFELDSDEDRGWISLEEFARRAGLQIADDVTRLGFGDHVFEKLAEGGIVPVKGGVIDEAIGKWNEVSG